MLASTTHVHHNARMVEFLLAVVAALGGGFARALSKNRRWVSLTWEKDGNGNRLFDPGSLGTAFVSIAAGVGVWLLSASPENSGIDFRPLGLALFAGAGGDIVIDYYVSQRYGASDQQGAGEALEQMASATNNQSRVVEKSDDERRQLQQELDEYKVKVAELEAENERLKESGASDALHYAQQEVVS